MSSAPPPHGFQPVQSLPEQPSRSPWLIVAGLVLAALGGVAVGALVFGGRPGATPNPTAVAASPSTPRTTAAPAASTPPAASAPSSPSASVSAGPSSPPSTAGPSAPGSPAPGPSGSIPPDVAAAIEEVIAQVPPIRELEQLREVPYRFISREQFRQDLLALLEEETDPQARAAEERMLKRLGLLPDDLDLEQLLLDLYGAGVAAFYQPQNGTFYIIERDEPFGALDRMYVAHEYDHALQDQHFDLEGTRITDPSQGDAAIAQLSVVEGDATWLMIEWAREHLDLEEMLEILTESLEPADQELLDEMPQILVRQLSFPYNEGMLFVSGIRSESGWSAVNDLFARPPASTEQVFHPEKYEAGEAPVGVELPDVSGSVGGGTQLVYQQTMGELNTQIWLAAGEEPPPMLPGVPIEYPYGEEAAGWGGDRLHMYESSDGAWAIVWQLAWDSAADADEFRTRAQELQSTLDVVSTIETVCDGADCFADQLRLLVASDQQMLDVMTDALARP